MPRRLSCLPVSTAPRHLNHISQNYGGVGGAGGRVRQLTSSSKAPPPPGRPTSAAPPQPKDKGQAALEKSERLHAELKEVRSCMCILF